MSHGVKHGETPEDRLSAAFKMLMIQFQDRHYKTGHGPLEPDIADIRDFIHPYLQRELLLRAIREVEVLQGSHSKRISDLVKELYVWEAIIPKENRL